MVNEAMKQTIRNIVHLTTCKQDFSEAAKLIVANNISMTQLSQLTFKLSVYNMARLTDSIIKHKKGK